MSDKDFIAAEDEVKSSAINYFQQNHSDEHGYVTEKVNFISKLEFGDAWVAFQKIHPIVRKVLFRNLSPLAKEYLIKKEMYVVSDNIFM